MYELSDLPVVTPAALRVAILIDEAAGCPTYPVLSVDRGEDPADSLSLPRMWQIPMYGDGVINVRHVPLGHRPDEVRREVWAALVVRDPETTAWLIDPALGCEHAVLGNEHAVGQVRCLAAAALHDICGQLMPAVADVLGYTSAGSAHGAAARGRSLWRALRAWPYACLAPGRLKPGWAEDEGVRLGLKLWRKEDGLERPPVGGWGPVADALAPEGRRRHSRGAGRVRSRTPSDQDVEDLLRHGRRLGVPLSTQQARGLIERYDDAARTALIGMTQHA
jgi:hypothetical protein